MARLEEAAAHFARGAIESGPGYGNSRSEARDAEVWAMWDMGLLLPKTGSHSKTFWVGSGNSSINKTGGLPTKLLLLLTLLIFSYN